MWNKKKKIFTTSAVLKYWKEFQGSLIHTYIFYLSIFFFTLSFFYLFSLHWMWWKWFSRCGLCARMHIVCTEYSFLLQSFIPLEYRQTPESIHITLYMYIFSKKRVEKGEYAFSRIKCPAHSHHSHFSIYS